MKEIKEITVFCEQGDSALLSTWSNVPYFLTETLMKKGIKVNRVNLSPKVNKIHKFIYKSFNAVAKGVFRNKFYTYRRTGLYFYLTKLKIKRAIRRYSNTDAFVFTTYNLSAKGLTSKPVLLFSDWTLDYDMRFFNVRTPDKEEQRFINRQNRNIEEADIVISLFPGMAKDMQERYTNPHIYYIGNVINALCEPDKACVKRKAEKTDILFVGNKNYKQGAMELIDAFAALKKELPLLSLHIIGMNDNDFSHLPEDVHCYGYLNKSKESERKKYYEFLEKASLFVNTRPKWGAFSASIEAMYFYTPVIVNPYGEFVNTFGENLSFGVFHKDGSLDKEIKSILLNADYENMAIAAHEVSKGFTWDRFVENMMDKLVLAE